MSVDQRANGQWRARWRERPGGPQKSEHFARKLDAERFLVKVKHDLMTGTYTDPRLAHTPLADYAEAWLERMVPTWRPTTSAAVANSVRLHISPTLGRHPLGTIKRADVEAWAAGLKLAPSTVATVRQHLGQILTAAVDDGLIARNPATKARMPRNEAAKPEPVSLDVAYAIMGALPSWAQVAVPLGLSAGLRHSEATGLTLDRVHFLKRTIKVDRQLVTAESASPGFGPPKTAQSHRTIPLTNYLGNALSAHLAEHGEGQWGLILHLPDGRPIGRNRFGRLWRTARAEVGAEHVDFHDLRHTFASTLLSEGVSIRAVSEYMGHASPVVTLNTYSHMMPADEDRARSVLDAAFAPSAAESLLSPSRLG